MRKGRRFHGSSSMIREGDSHGSSLMIRKGRRVSWVVVDDKEGKESLMGCRRYNAVVWLQELALCGLAEGVLARAAGEFASRA
jgi:hypothetical protein